MELRFVVPNMEKTFGNLEFAGENTTEQQRINGRIAVINRSYNLYSDVQRADVSCWKSNRLYRFDLCLLATAHHLCRKNQTIERT